MRSLCGETEDFNVRIGMHQGTTFSFYIFFLVMNENINDIQGGVPWCMLYVGDMVLIGEISKKSGR